MTSKGAPDPLAFLKILDLEKSRGYKDTAVIGGLDLLLQLNKSELANLVADTDGVKLLEVSYGSLNISKRRQWVQNWLSRLNKPDSQDNGPGPGVPAQQTAVKPVPPRVPVKKRASPPLGLSIDSPVDRLRGVETKTSARLQRLGVSTIRDLMYLFPRRHNDYSNVAKISELEPGQDHTIVGTVWEARETKMGQRGRLKATEAVLSDETGNIRVVWFGQPYLAKVLKPNSRVAISGRVDVYKSQLQFQSPEFELLDRAEGLIHTGRLVPVYPLTQGLTPRKMRGLVSQAIEKWGGQLEDFLPEDLRARLNLGPLPAAVVQAHYPDDATTLERSRRRLAFDEFFLLQMAVLTRRKQWQDTTQGVPIEADPKVLDGFLASLPFSLTGAQERCLGEILGDIKRSAPPMNRLLQGEVGSGKTVVALAALLAVASRGHQGSIMVPTEVLAEQHFETVTELLGGVTKPVRENNLIAAYLDPLPGPISVGLLTGSTKATAKREIQRRASEGTLDILIGTQALIQEGVEMPRLALAVADEQHRFGVTQRAALRQKGTVSPHVLVMSATPIPRTLALTLYGDLDISTIDEMPAGRQMVQTLTLAPERRDAAYEFVRKQVQDGRQAFVICPLIEESEAVEARAATEEYKRLSKEVFPDLRVGLLHGKMPSREKDLVMRSFRDGGTDILVSTAVVEVGIDVPNATVMAVEGAHRFGLAQLHQFRGRVGRGEHKSYCLLVSEYSSQESRERLAAMENIHDGFKLAEVDLKLRGPGDFFGTRQSGLPALRVATLADHDLLRLARDEAAKLLKKDPRLKSPSHKPLAREVSRFLERVRDEVS